MKIMQLFKASVPNELFVKVCQCFGYEVANEDFSFCKMDLERLDTVRRMNCLRDELCQYYIPCKAKLYLTNLNELKCITVFRQLLRLNNITLVSRQRYVKHKKITFYSLKFDEENKDERLNHMTVNNNHLVVNFS
jgi:hypothetical protein